MKWRARARTKFTHWLIDKFQVFKEKSPQNLDFPGTQFNQQDCNTKKKKSNWGGSRENSGGAREGAGRKYKFYPAIKLDYNPGENKESILKAMIDLYTWLLADKIEARKAATTIHILESIAEIRIPAEWEEDLDKLKVEAKRLRELLQQRKAENQWDKHQIN